MNTHSKHFHRKLKPNYRSLCKSNRPLFSHKEQISQSVDRIHDLIQNAKSQLNLSKSLILNSKTIPVSRLSQFVKTETKQVHIFSKTIQTSQTREISQSERCSKLNPIFIEPSLREMMINKTKIEQQDKRNIADNPFYKIMRKRINTCPTSNTKPKPNLYQSYQNQIYFKQQDKTLDQDQDQEVFLKSSFKSSIEQPKNVKVQPVKKNSSKLRKGSKCSQEIHKYFDLKYGIVLKNPIK